MNNDSNNTKKQDSDLGFFLMILLPILLVGAIFVWFFILPAAEFENTNLPPFLFPLIVILVLGIIITMIVVWKKLRK